MRPPVLYVGHDHRKAVVSIVPLKVDGGVARKERWGRVVEIFPGGRTLANQLFGTRHQPVIVAPKIRRDAVNHYLLGGRQERNALELALQVARRICRTLPALAGMVDADASERLLAHALFDLARLLERRQDLRGLREEVRRQRASGLPPDSAAVRELLVRRDRLAQVMSDLDRDVRRRINGLAMTAIAGENFIRERQISQVVSEVDHTLATMAPSAWAPPDAGAQLAGRIDAVLAAYRELSDRYGGGG